MKSINLEIATNWNDLTRKQLLYLCRLILAGMDKTRFSLLLFLRLTGVKALPQKVVKDQVYYLFKRGKTRFMMTPEELTWFLKSVDFLTYESKLEKNLFPVFRIGLRTYYGPSKRCYNLRFLEFVNAEKCFHAFNKTRNVKYLNELCAVLYRPEKKDYHPLSPDYDGDRREPFNDFIYQKRARRFRFLSANKRYAVYIFYAGCRNALITAHPLLFEEGSVSSESSNPVDGLLKPMYLLNMGDITKNREIEQVQVWEAFAQLEEMAKAAKQHK
jgi:hypothetical protein